MNIGPLVVAHSSLPGLSVNRIEPYALPIFIRVSAHKNDTFSIIYHVHIIVKGTRERTGCLADLFSLSLRYVTWSKSSLKGQVVVVSTAVESSVYLALESGRHYSHRKNEGVSKR